MLSLVYAPASAGWLSLFTLFLRRLQRDVELGLCAGFSGLATRARGLATVQKLSLAALASTKGEKASSGQPATHLLFLPWLSSTSPPWHCFCDLLVAGATTSTHTCAL
jgi:hypothetical protein